MLENFALVCSTAVSSRRHPSPRRSAHVATGRGRNIPHKTVDRIQICIRLARPAVPYGARLVDHHMLRVSANAVPNKTSVSPRRSSRIFTTPCFPPPGPSAAPQDTLPRSNMQGTVQAPPAPRETTARAPRTTSPPSPPPPLPPPPPPPPLTRQPGRQPRRSSRVSPSRDGRRTRPDSGIAGAKATAAAAAAAAAARKRRRVTDPPPPPPPPSVSSSEELDALQRRVKEILDEYCSKAPLPEEQWPPGRRIRVRGVEIFYKVWVHDFHAKPMGGGVGDRRCRCSHCST